MDKALRKNYIALLCICVVTVVAGNDEEFFLRGNKYYEQKDYDNALQSYVMMSKKGRTVLYNMGNACFHKGDYADALVYWSRAEVGATPQEYHLIARNKEHVFAIMNKQVDKSIKHKIMKLLYHMFHYFFYNFFFSSVGICYFL